MSSAPYTPPTDPSNETDTQNFDSAFLDMVPSVNGDGETGEGLASVPSAATAAAASANADDDRASLFDGYSYRERDAASILLEEDEPLSPVDRISAEHPRQTSQEDDHDRVTPSSQEALSADTLEETLSRDNDSSSTIHEDALSLTAPSTTADDSSASEAVDPARLVPLGSRSNTHARQRSGIPALDRGLPSDLEDEEDSESDDEWDLIEKPRDGRAESNGSRGTTLFARGVVDRYRLGVLKKKESRATLVTARTAPLLEGSGSPESKFRRGITFTSSKFKPRPKPVTSQSYSTPSTSTRTDRAVYVAHAASASQPAPSALSPKMSASLSLPVNLAPGGHDRPAGSDHSAGSSRPGSVSPTKASRTRIVDDSDPLSSSSSSRFKKMGKQSTDKMMSIFGGSKSTAVSSSPSSTPTPQPSP